MEAWLSQHAIPFDLRDVGRQPVDREELWTLLHDEQGQQLGPITQIGSDWRHERGDGRVIDHPSMVLGLDLVRLGEKLDQHERLEGPVDQVIVNGRPGGHGTQEILSYVRGRGITAVHRDTSRDPLSKDELWRYFVLPEGGGRIATPLTVVDGRVVLGNDEQLLAEILLRPKQH